MFEEEEESEFVSWFMHEINWSRDSKYVLLGLMFLSFFDKFLFSFDFFLIISCIFVCVSVRYGRRSGEE